MRGNFELDALERSADHARLALACPFSSSAEYEAELIRERRAAGHYGPQRNGLPFTAVALGLTVIVGFILLV